MGELAAATAWVALLILGVSIFWLVMTREW